MEQIKITLKGDVREFPKGRHGGRCGQSHWRRAVQGGLRRPLEGETVDLRTPLEEDGELEILTFQEAEGKHAYWHTASHVMAQAVQAAVPRGQAGDWPRD